MVRALSFLLTRSIAARLMAAFVLFSIPVLFVGVQLVVKQNEEINFSQRELTGTHFLSPAIKLHASLVNVSARGHLDAATDKKITELFSILTEEADEHQQLFNVSGSVEDLQQRLQKLKKDKFEPWAIDGAIQTSQHLITEIAEQSNLILDPQLDTFYLMELSAIRAAPLIEQINSFSTAKHQLLQSDLGGDRDAVAVQEGMLQALRANFDRSLKAAVKAGGATDEYALLLRLNLDVQMSVDRLISTRDPYDIQMNSRAARQSISRAAAVSGDLLVTLLTKRIARIVEQQRVVLFGASFLFLGAVLVGLAILRDGVVRPLAALTAAMKRVARGEHHVEPPSRDRRDEVGDMARALDVFRENAIARLQAEHAAAAKAEFLAVMSHEIRTPMNGVLGMTQALASSKLDNAQRKMLSVIQESGDTLLALLNDILDMSKIEAGKLELESIPFAPSRLLESARDLFDVRASQKGLQLITAMEPGADVWRLGDPARLRQVVFNLVSNAIKFTEAGTVTLRLGSNEQGHLTISVKDTGIGIPANDLARLFTKFTQIDSSHTRKFGGTGLGLSIAKAIIETMGGDIIVASEIGVGSCFTIVVPLAVTQPSATQEPAPIAPPPSPVYRELVEDNKSEGVRVLVAEDNPTNRFVLQTLLEGIGIVPSFAENGQEAVELWQQAPFDIILMDMQMPIMDGIAAMGEIRRLEGQQGLARIPIVALTANAMPHQIHEQVAAGADAHAAKPIQLALLVAAMEDAIGRCDVINEGQLIDVDFHQIPCDADDKAA